MNSSSNGVYVDNLESQAFSGLIMFQLYDPHACIFIRLFISGNKPVNKGTWIVMLLVFEGEKKEDLCNDCAIHPTLVFIQDDKNHIMAWMTEETRI